MRDTKRAEGRPEDWTMLQKLAVIIEAHELGPEWRAQFLGERGLCAEQVELWKVQIKEFFEKSKKRRRRRSG
tara:strand:- start:94 stop:309 length:216 start_codon:yes stop_codon:yes gene_type:complete